VREVGEQLVLQVAGPLGLRERVRQQAVLLGLPFVRAAQAAEVRGNGGDYRQHDGKGQKREDRPMIAH